MLLNIEDVMTYIKNVEDIPYLRTPLLPVNMRLWHSSTSYRAIIQHCCDYMKQIVLSDLDGYSEPYGISGANVAIPFNIIGIVHARSRKGKWAEILINPSYEPESQSEDWLTQSNCGSIRLPKPIIVRRHSRIKVSWWDEQGKFHQLQNLVNAGTIQHEVDHNRGILITDREVK
jgi:peptide deformylase